MHRDLLELMEHPTVSEAERAKEAIAVAKRGANATHTPESLATFAALSEDRPIVGREPSWEAALIRLERAENDRRGASPLTTIDRARQLGLDIEIQRHARNLVIPRDRGHDQKHVEPTKSMRLALGDDLAGNVAIRMDAMSTEALREFGSGRGISNPDDAIAMGRILAPALDTPIGGLDTEIADRFGIRLTRGLMDRLTGVSEEGFRPHAQEEERRRMMEIEDRVGVARGRGTADTVAPRTYAPEAPQEAAAVEAETAYAPVRAGTMAAMMQAGGHAR